MERTVELESRNICRICLTQEDDANFTDIFETSSLPMEMLSIGSVEVFESDGMPRKICECCRIILGNAYKFKQICKRSDTLLKMYPMTGNVPPRIQIPTEMLPIRKQAKTEPEEPIRVVLDSKSVGVGPDDWQRDDLVDSCTQTDPEPEMTEMIGEDRYLTSQVIAPPAEFSVENEYEEGEEEEEEAYEELPRTRRVTSVLIQGKNSRAQSIKILNKSKQALSAPPKQFKRFAQVKMDRAEASKVKILNAQVKTENYEEVDSMEAGTEGNIQIVSFNEEYLEENEWEAKAKRIKTDESEHGVVYTCGVCDKGFPLLQQLEIHKKNHERARNHPCPDCDKSFFSKYDLQKHTLTHTKQKDYQCVVCSRSFSRSTLLYRHEKVHNDPDIPRYQCTSCDRVYLNNLDYEKHSQTHTKNRPYACDVCDKRFAFKQGLERHSVIHDNESQPYPCQYCEFRFPSTSKLQRHLSKDHAGERPFPCSKCTKRFMLSHHLYRHMRTAHAQDDITTYQCPECDEPFGDRDEFFLHCSEHTAYTLSCPLCKISFDTSEDAHDHVQLHANSDMYFCDYCNLIYMNQEDLNLHFIDQHSNELCSVGEEIQYVIEEKAKIPVASKKRKGGVGKQAPKRTKAEAHSDIIQYDAGDEVESEQLVEFLNEDQYIVSDIEAPAFVEYEEEDSSYELPSKPIDSPKKPLEATRKFYSRVSNVEKKPAPQPASKASPRSPTVQRVKMSAAKIEQLKREGKIKMVNGELTMRN